MQRFIAYWITIAVFAVGILVPQVGRPDPAVPDDPVRQKRLEFLQSRVDQYEIKFADDSRKLTRGAQTILRWSNPVREFTNDGVTYLFLDGQRPHAVVTAWASSAQANIETGEIWREFVSLSGPALVCRRDGGVLWSPVTRSDVNQAIEGAPAPANKAPQRLAQMRELARRFQAKNFKMEMPNELRLLTQPLYRYQDETAGILDGALFAFVEANDPEVLLLLEAAGSNGKEPQWRYTLARMTSYRVQVKLDDRDVFDRPPYWKGPRQVDDLYMEAREGMFTLPK